MADVTILFAREDRARAEGIGAALAGSGFSVEAIPYEALSGTLESPAIVALWSRTMAASRTAISLGQSALASGRLISARLDINVPSGLFRNHVMHDLIRWAGDPDDQVLDSLVADADQLVLAARAAPPPPNPGIRAVPPPPEPVRLQQVANGGARPVARPSPANDLTPAVASDPSAEEAAYWKTIRASVNREDFVNYLTRYGEDGLFAELAMQKLAALPRPAPEPPAPQQPVARFADSWRFGADWSTRGPAAPPTDDARYAAESRAPAPTARAPQAPEPAPPERRPQIVVPAPAAKAAPGAGAKPAQTPLPPSKRVPVNRLPEPAARRVPAGGAGAFDRELADAPWDRQPSSPPRGLDDNALDGDLLAPRRAVPAARKRSGGGFGAVLGVLIVLGAIGGGAAYWLLRTAQAPAGESELAWPGSEAAPARVDPDALGDAPAAVALDAAGNLPRASASPATGPAATPTGRALLSPRVVETTTGAEQRPSNANPSTLTSATAVIVPPPSEAVTAASPAVEAPVANVEAVFSYGRPLDESAAATSPGSVPGEAVSQSVAPQPVAPIGPKPNIIWSRRPNASAISTVYPPEANRRGIEGKAVLGCSVLASGELLCNVTSESPAGQGFGRAALEAARRFRSAPTLSNGAPSAGVRTSVVISFALN